MRVVYDKDGHDHEHDVDDHGGDVEEETGRYEEPGFKMMMTVGKMMARIS